MFLQQCVYMFHYFPAQKVAMRRQFSERWCFVWCFVWIRFHRRCKLDMAHPASARLRFLRYYSWITVTPRMVRKCFSTEVFYYLSRFGGA